MICSHGMTIKNSMDLSWFILKSTSQCWGYRRLALYHGEAMTIPAEATVHMKATLVGESGNNVFDGASQNVPIVRQAGGKGRPVVEGVPTRGSDNDSEGLSTAPQN